MTTEMILLLGVFVFALMGVLMKVPKDTFAQSGPRLGVRIEQQLDTGSKFGAKGAVIRWEVPDK